MLRIAKEYKNRFKIRISDKRYDVVINKLGKLYGGHIETDATLQHDEYWYHTDADKEAINNSILIEHIE